MRRVYGGGSAIILATFILDMWLPINYDLAASWSLTLLALFVTAFGPLRILVELASRPDRRNTPCQEHLPDDRALVNRSVGVDRHRLHVPAAVPVRHLRSWRAFVHHDVHRAVACAASEQ